MCCTVLTVYIPSRQDRWHDSRRCMCLLAIQEAGRMSVLVSVSHCVCEYMPMSGSHFACPCMIPCQLICQPVWRWNYQLGNAQIQAQKTLRGSAVPASISVSSVFFFRLFYRLTCTEPDRTAVLVPKNTSSSRAPKPDRTAFPVQTDMSSTGVCFPTYIALGTR